jgi:hypothetical protein
MGPVGVLTNWKWDRVVSPLFHPANNPVLRPPVAGKVGLWSKTDSTSYFKDYVVSPQP